MNARLTYVSGSVYLKVVEITTLKNIKGRKFPCELVAQIFSIFFLSSFFYASFVAAFSCLFILPSTSSSNSKSFSCILCRRRRRRHWSCFACKQEKVFREFFCKIHEILFCFNKKKSRIENITRFFYVISWNFSSDFSISLATTYLITLKIFTKKKFRISILKI